MFFLSLAKHYSTGLWLAIIFIIAGSICHISLFTTKTSPAYFLELSNDVIPILPKEISKPALHPLLITTIVFIVPVFLCILPNSLTFSRTYSTVNTFEGLLPRLSGPYGSLEDVISSMPLSQNGTSTKPEDASLAVITAGITSILGSWRMENLMRACTGAVLLVILIFIEYALQKRLSQAGMYLQEVERAALNGSPAANSAIMIKNDGPNMTDFLDEKGGAYIQSTAGRSINRTRSILSSSTRSDVRPSSLYPSEGPRRPQSALSRSCVSHPGLRPSSRASSNRSFSAMSVSSSKLYVPELPEFDVTLPSPSLMKDDLESSIRGIGGEGPSPYLPALALFGDRLDRSVGCFGGHTLFGEESGLSSSRTPSLSRRISLTSSLNYSEKAFEPRKRPTSTIPEQITPIPDYNEKKLDDTTQDYFGDGQLPYDIDDGYDAQLDKSECSAAVAHMLAPYDGAEEEERDVGHSIPTYMQRDDTRRSHLSRSYTPGLRNEHNLRMSVRSPSVASRRSHIHVRPQSRASSYSYRSQSSLKSSTFSYSSKRTAASWRSKLFQHETYQGPSASNLRALKSSRIIEATLLGLFILVASLLELVCGIAGWSILESKAVSESH